MNKFFSLFLVLFAFCATYWSLAPVTTVSACANNYPCDPATPTPKATPSFYPTPTEGPKNTPRPTPEVSPTPKREEELCTPTPTLTETPTPTATPTVTPTSGSTSGGTGGGSSDPGNTAATSNNDGEALGIGGGDILGVDTLAATGSNTTMLAWYAIVIGSLIVAASVYGQATQPQFAKK